MEFFVAYYPMIKLGVIALVGYVIGYLAFKGKTVSSLTIFSIALVVYTMIPVRIDGTNTKVAHQHEKQYQDSKYTYQSEEIPMVETKVLSFDEQMALVDKKNEKKNEMVKKEINE